MLVSFRPSVPNVNTPSVNRKNPDKISFQQLLSSAEIKEITKSSGDAINFVISVKTGMRSLTEDAKGQLRSLLESLEADVRVYIAQALK